MEFAITASVTADDSYRIKAHFVGEFA